MEASVIPGWNDFFVAVAGVAGALVGLVFVALSINLPRIIKMPGVSGRAAETIVLLAGALVGSLVALMPHLSLLDLGLLLLVSSLNAWGWPMAIQMGSILKREYPSPALAAIRVTLYQAAALPGVAGAGLLCAGAPSGIGLFAIGTVLSMLVALFNAWVLLVEILR
jgi:modulator of FtsH protease